MDIFGTVEVSLEHDLGVNTDVFEREDKFYDWLTKHIDASSSDTCIVKFPFNQASSFGGHFAIINFSTPKGLKGFCKGVMGDKANMEVEIPGISFSLSLKINDLPEDFNFDNSTFVTTSINVLAKNQDYLSRQINSLIEFSEQQTRFNRWAVGKDKADEIMLGFDRKSDKWH